MTTVESLLVEFPALRAVLDEARALGVAARDDPGEWCIVERWLGGVDGLYARCLLALGIAVVRLDESGVPVRADPRDPASLWLDTTADEGVCPGPELAASADMAVEALVRCFPGCRPARCSLACFGREG